MEGGGPWPGSGGGQYSARLGAAAASGSLHSTTLLSVPPTYSVRPSPRGPQLRKGKPRAVALCTCGSLCQGTLRLILEGCFFHSLQGHQPRRPPTQRAVPGHSSHRRLCLPASYLLCVSSQHSAPSDIGLSPWMEQQVQGQGFWSSSFIIAAQVPSAVSSASLNE